jgi:hypothetical protein
MDTLSSAFTGPMAVNPHLLPLSPSWSAVSARVSHLGGQEVAAMSFDVMDVSKL